MSNMVGESNDPNSGSVDANAEALAAKKAAEQAAAAQAALTQAGSDALGGPGKGILDLYGTPEQQHGAVQGLQFGQMLYGQGIGDIGKEASDYSNQLRSRLGTDSVKADLYRQSANRRIDQGAGKLGMAGANLGGAKEQLYRQSGFEADAANQAYKDSALAAVGRNIGAKQQGLASQFRAGQGIGNAQTPGAVADYNSGMSVICTELYNQGKISKNEWQRACIFGYMLKQNTYFGYLTIARPIVELMKKSDKFSNLFIGWAKSIAAQKPNLLTRALLPICWMVGYVRQIKKEKTFRIA